MVLILSNHSVVLWVELSFVKPLANLLVLVEFCQTKVWFELFELCFVKLRCYFDGLYWDWSNHAVNFIVQLN